MKKHCVCALAAMCVASLLLAGTAVPAYAAQPDNSKEIAEMGKWLDGLTLTPSGGASGEQQPERLTADELKAYADKVFELVNKERENAGLAPLERDGTLDGAAMLRASEVKAVSEAGGRAHTRPDGTSYRALLDALGVAGDRCGENFTCGRPTPQNAMDAWMNSEGHRKNILRDNYGSIGIGVYQRPDGKLDWIQIFMLQ